MIIPSEVTEMNKDDISVAIEFMHGLDLKYLVLQCHKAQDIPYVKRALIQMLGEPRKMIDNSFYYEEKRIMIVPLSKDTTGLGEEHCFYVAYKDDSDWNRIVLGATGGLPNTLVPTVTTPWFTISELYVKLWSDEGMSGSGAWALLTNEEVKSL